MRKTKLLLSLSNDNLLVVWKRRNEQSSVFDSMWKITLRYFKSFDINENESEFFYANFNDASILNLETKKLKEINIYTDNLEAVKLKNDELIVAYSDALINVYSNKSIKTDLQFYSSKKTYFAKHKLTSSLEATYEFYISGHEFGRVYFWPNKEDKIGYEKAKSVTFSANSTIMSLKSFNKDQNLLVLDSKGKVFVYSFNEKSFHLKHNFKNEINSAIKDSLVDLISPKEVIVSSKYPLTVLDSNFIRP
jgi:hypothetical protein